MITLQNEMLSAKIAAKGAELQSLYSKEHQLEYLWQANPEYWGKQSPILFPVIGELKEQIYLYNGHAYKLPRHGFARDMEFAAGQINEQEAVFTLGHSDETLEKYPFLFRLAIHYKINGNSLSVTYKVSNVGIKPLYFSIGGHPAFNIPLAPHTEYEDYYLQLEKKESVDRWLLKEGLLDGKEHFLQNEDILPLKKELFYNDAIVLKHLVSDSISIKSNKTSRGLTMDFEGFPYFGIWSAKDAPFICLEPWCGHADNINHNQLLTEKEGMYMLEHDESWERSWRVTCY